MNNSWTTTRRTPMKKKTKNTTKNGKTDPKLKAKVRSFLTEVTHAEDVVVKTVASLIKTSTDLATLKKIEKITHKGYQRQLKLNELTGTRINTLLRTTKTGQGSTKSQVLKVSTQ